MDCYEAKASSNGQSIFNAPMVLKETYMMIAYALPGKVWE